MGVMAKELRGPTELAEAISAIVFQKQSSLRTSAKARSEAIEQDEQDVRIFRMESVWVASHRDANAPLVRNDGVAI